MGAQIRTVKSTQITTSTKVSFLVVCCVCLLIWAYKNSVNITQWKENVLLGPEQNILSTGNVTGDTSVRKQEEKQSKEELEELQVCKFPKLDHLDQKVYSAFLRDVADVTPVNCGKTPNEVFHTSIDSQKLFYSEKNFKILNLTKCYYRYFSSSNTTEHEIILSKKVFNIAKSETIIPSSHEYIFIECLNKATKSNKSQPAYRDVHAFVPLINVPTNKDKSDKVTSIKRPNVVILLLSSISRMSFIRAMPKTYAYLKENLNAIELTGLAKLGDETLPSILPMLTNKSWAETESLNGCVPDNSTPFDKCSFIWKDFKKQGYITSFAEDAITSSTFVSSGRRGFFKKPTDSYFQPLFHAMVKANLTSDYDQCAGSKPRISLLTDYMKKVGIASNQKNRPYFQLVISKSTFFTDAYSIYHDGPIEDFLKWFRNKGFFNNSIFILMSDHGGRWGKVKETPQGNIESKMPFAFFLLPQWFKEKYPLANENLMKNRNRLTTPFDFYATFKDIINLDKALEDKKLTERSINLDKIELMKMPRGISLFLPIPLKRACSIAGIPGIYCLCNLDESIELNPKSKLSLSAASKSIKFINGKISKVRNLCKEMEITKIESAKLRKDGNGTNLQTIDLTFVTQPGRTTFEASLVANIEFGSNSSRYIRAWNVVDVLTSTHIHAYSSWCLKTKALKMYCFCKEPNPKDNLVPKELSS